MPTPAHLWAMDAVNPIDTGDPGGNNGTGSNVTVVTGDMGSALEFNGSDSNVNVGDVAELNAAEKFTISFWMNQDVLDAWDQIFIKFFNALRRIEIKTLSGLMFFITESGGTGYGSFDYSTAIGAEAWHHVAMVFDGALTGNANRLKVYVDGVPIVLTFNGTIPSATYDLLAVDALIGNTSNAFDGDLNSFYIYADALTAAEVEVLADRSPSWTDDDSNVTAVDTATYEDVIVSWDAAVLNAAGLDVEYTVQYRVYSNGAWTTYARTDQTSLRLSGLTNGERYQFRVLARTRDRDWGNVTPDDTASAVPSFTATTSADGHGLAEAMRDWLLLDSVIVAAVETYEFTSNSPSPAIFTTDVIPEDASLPAVIINEFGGPAWGTRAREGGDVLVRVRVYGDKDRETSTLRRLAWNIRESLNRSSLNMTNGYDACRVIADVPMLTTDVDGFPGYSIDVRAIVLAR